MTRRATADRAGFPRPLPGVRFPGGGVSREAVLAEMAAEPGAWFLTPSVFRRTDGTPLFHMPMRRADLADPGAGVLHFHETRLGGFEYGLRRFLLEHLAPGDLFMDLGAHWGVYALTVASRHPGQVRVLAVEPHPDNVRRLRLWLDYNEAAGSVAVVPAAVDAAPGTGRLFLNSTMGHRLAMDQETAVPKDFRPPIQVPVTTLDALAREHGADQAARVILKMDLEGHEPQALSGGVELLKSGKVGAIIWEKGREYARPENHRRFVDALGMLADLGFDNFRFPGDEAGGCLVPYLPCSEMVNIISLARDFPRRPAYPRPWGVQPVRPALARPPMSEAETADFVDRLMRARATDAGRWAAWERLTDPSTHLRAGLAAQHLKPGMTVLDLGCGSMALREYLPAGCRYVPLDLAARGPNCLLGDLNQGQYPTGRADAIFMLHLLEFIHDPRALLTWAARSASLTVLSYRSLERLPAAHRRQAGFFNDFTASGLAGLIVECGFAPPRTDGYGGEILYVCTPRAAEEKSAP